MPCQTQVLKSACYLSCLLAAWLFFGSSTQCHGQDGEVRKAFSESGDFPWYDDENERLRAVNVPPGGRASTLDRDTIPEADPTINPINNSNVSEGTNFAFSKLILIVMLVVGVVGIIGLLVWALMRFSNKNSNNEKELDEKIEFTPERIEALPFDLQNSASHGDLLTLARQAYNANDFRNAAIYLYSHVLLSLDHFGWIRLTRGKTNRQYLRELRDQQKMSGFFERLMVGFEQAFFGKYSLSRDEFDTSWALVDTFQQDVKNPPRP